MPDQDYKILWDGPQDLDRHAVYMAELLYKHVRAQFWAHYRAGLLSSRERILLSQLLPRLDPKARLDKQQAYNVLLAVEVLRCATTSLTHEEEKAQAQAQDIKAEELVGEQLLAQGDTGQAD